MTRIRAIRRIPGMCSRDGRTIRLRPLGFAVTGSLGAGHGVARSAKPDGARVSRAGGGE